MDEKSEEFARIKPDVVARSIEEFCKASYSVDVLKVGVPVNMNFVESANLPRSRAVYSRSDEVPLYARITGGFASLELFVRRGRQRNICGCTDVSG
jgi:tagatose-1,6-bisphosphate aldolase